MKKAIQQSDYSLLGLLFFKDDATVFKKGNAIGGEPHFISDVYHELEGYQLKRFYYIANNDGTIRWIYPEECKVPLFLSFYNASFLKAKLFKLFFRLIFLLGLSKKINHGSFTIYYQEEPYLYQVLEQIPHDHISVFTGTVGSTRKFIIATSIRRRINYFVKYALKEKGIEAVEAEKQNLLLLGNDLKGLIPGVLDLGVKGIVAVENMKNHHNFGSNDFKAHHVHFLDKLYKIGLNKMKYFETDFFTEIQQNIEAIEHLDIKNEIHEKDTILKALKTIHKELIDEDRSIMTSWSHQDFTPWNMYMSKDKLFVYDFELAKQNMPVFFDVFHFFMQRGVLIERKSYDLIKEDIDKAFIQFDIKHLLDKEVNIDRYFKLYLLIIVSYYLKRYLVQDQLHIQAHWLTSVWNAALLNLISENAS